MKTHIREIYDRHKAQGFFVFFSKQEVEQTLQPLVQILNYI